jgi:hypothetical protein
MKEQSKLILIKHDNPENLREISKILARFKIYD